jgi:hypothetical protein
MQNWRLKVTSEECYGQKPLLLTPPHTPGQAAKLSMANELAQKPAGFELVANTASQVIGADCA